MHLRQINMENFKSFGHKVSIPFDDGFTAVTGPNGSGKSNISDAILFVLGPRSAKAIRAGKLSDLIFNGGGTGKPPSKYCWVELVFDNADRLMPIETDEVRLRRLIRMSTQKKGEYNSYFYINDRASSLNEFDALLAHARISAEGYNLVQQGDINRITAMSNLERRRILDDIAGITRFDEDIDSANKKRAQAEENMGRIQLVLEEVKRNIAILEKDKDAAAKYKDIQERLALARAQLVHLDVEEARDFVEQTRRKEETCKADLEKFTKGLADLKGELGGVVEEYDAAEAAIAELGGGASKERRAKLEGLTVEIAKADQRAEKAKESLDEARQLRKQLGGELKKMERDLQAAEKQRQEAGAERDRLTKQLEASRKELDGWRQNAARTDKDVADLQRLAALKAKDLQDAQKERHEIELELDRLSERIGQGELLLKELDEKVKSQDLQAADAQFQIAEIKNATSGAKGTLERLQKRMAELKREEKELAEDQVKAEREVTQLAREFGAMRAEAEAQLGIERGYVRSVTDVLQAKGRGELKGDGRRACQGRRQVRAGPRDGRRLEDAGARRRRRRGGRRCDQPPQEDKVRPRDLPASQQAARDAPAGQGAHGREGPGRRGLRDRPREVRRAVRGRHDFHVRRDARRQEPRRGAPPHGWRKARDDGRRPRGGRRRHGRRDAGSEQREVRDFGVLAPRPGPGAP